MYSLLVGGAFQLSAKSVDGLLFARIGAAVR